MSFFEILPPHVPPAGSGDNTNATYRSEINRQITEGDNEIYFSTPLESANYDVKPFCYSDTMAIPWFIVERHADHFVINVAADCVLDYSAFPVI